eukprot:gene16985-18697_t
MKATAFNRQYSDEQRQLEVTLRAKETQISRQKREMLKLKTDILDARAKASFLERKHLSLKNNLFQKRKEVNVLEIGNTVLKGKLSKSRRTSDNELSWKRENIFDMTSGLQNMRIELQNRALQGSCKDCRIKQISNDIKKSLLNSEVMETTGKTLQRTPLLPKRYMRRELPSLSEGKKSTKEEVTQ